MEPAAPSAPPELVLAVFVVFLAAVAGIGIVLARRRKRARHRASERAPLEAMTGSAGSLRKGRLVGTLAFGVFLLAGLGFMIPFALMFWGLLDSRGWEQTRCTVLTSEVGTHSGGDGATYSIDISYRYTWADESYTADRYRFGFGSSSGYEGKAEVVARYPEGEEVACWVDPDRPQRAVLSRSVGWEALFVILPLVFVLVGGLGVLGMLGAFGGLGARARRRDDWLPGTGDEERGERWEAAPGVTASELAGPVADPHLLVPATTPKVRLVGSIVGAIFWNGIVWTILYFVSRESDGFSGCVIVFLGIFVLVGLLLLASVPYYALALANPRPSLRLGGDLAPGRSVSLSWRFDGRAERIERLVVRLEGREEATYRRGTDTHTSKHTFYERVILDTTQPSSIASGDSTLEIPAGTMHSFDGGNNEIVWSLAIHGSIPRWPDVEEELTLTVKPEGLAG